MLLVDRRAGSKDLLAPLLRLGIDAQLTELPFGDLAFTGKGPDDTALDVGIEFKQLGELVTCIRDGRFSGHQLPGMQAMYDYSWLLVEGLWKSGPKGDMLVPHRHEWRPVHGSMPAAEYNKHLLTFELCGGMHVAVTPSRHDTLRFISDLYRWWTDRRFDDHTSHLTPHRAGGFLPVSEFRRLVMVLPGVGRKASKAVETHFGGSLRQACLAGIGEWAGIETIDRAGKPRRLGIKVATQIVTFIRGEG